MFIIKQNKTNWTFQSPMDFMECSTLRLIVSVLVIVVVAVIYSSLYSFMESNGHKRGRRKDYVAQFTTFSSNDELDPWTAWAYKPRTITFLFIGSCFLMYVSHNLCFTYYILPSY